MSNTTLHWGLRPILHHLHDGARGLVLICYILHANERNRAWPSIKTLCTETGFGQTAVIAAKQWLIDRKALEYVPVEKRIGAKEEELHHRCDVMQLTGVLEIDGLTYPILHFNEYQNKEIIVPPGVTSPDVTTPGDTEVIEDIDDDSDSSSSSSFNFLSSDNSQDSSEEIVRGVRIPASLRTANAFEAWSRAFPHKPLTELTGQDLGRWIDEYGERDVIAAIVLAARNNAVGPLSYMQRIFEQWAQGDMGLAGDAERFRRSRKWDEIES